MTAPLVLKLGGELIETPAGCAGIAVAVARVASVRPLVVVHGGGRAIDAELARRGLSPSKVDGLRITDAPTLNAVVAVLAGSANTSLVAALVARGVAAVGLTGVDAGLGASVRARPHLAASGVLVDLGLVGEPETLDVSLLDLLVRHGYVPVVASLGLETDADDASVLNVNADVMACRLAAALAGSELVLAGTTAGVLDAEGATIPRLDPEGIDALIAGGTATAGMVAKLSACRRALSEGVSKVSLVDGRMWAAAVSADFDLVPGTSLAAPQPRAEEAALR
jgi:acetylglutamate kinase